MESYGFFLKEMNDDKTPNYYKNFKLLQEIESYRFFLNEMNDDKTPKKMKIGLKFE